MTFTPDLNLLTLSSIQRQAYILDVHVRCTTSETFYSVKISVARATQLRRLIVGIAGLLQCTHPLAFAPNSLTVRILNTDVVFNTKSRSGYVLSPDLLSEVNFCRLCGFVFTEKRRKKNDGEFAKMFESGWCGSVWRAINAQCVTRVGIELRNRGRVGCLYR